MHKIIILFTITILLFSCSNSSEQKSKQKITTAEQEPKQEVLLKGKTGTINTNKTSYTYYLPANYNDSVKYPVFIIFDPHASGDLPINLYKSYAEKYGYMLVASNDSKNGTDYQHINNIINSLLDDILNRLSIDTNRIYTMGFSGGARVASLMAFNKYLIKGCVLCGGGLMQNILSNHKVTILSFAGNTDFNLNELLELNKNIPDSFYHHLIIYDGKHQWPDSLTIEDAFYWTIFNEIRDGLRPLNKNLINEFYDKNIKLAKKTNKTNKLKAYYIYLKIYNFLKGLIKTDDIENELSKISKNSLYKKQVSEQKNILKTEQNKEQELMQNFVYKDTVWWNKKIKELAKDTLKNNNISQSNKRILAFLGLVSYMQTNTALRQNQILVAEKYDAIYKYVNPKNTEAYYLGALISAKQKNTGKVLKNLKQALLLGFDDLNRINNEPSFAYLSNNQQFIDLINNNYK